MLLYYPNNDFSRPDASPTLLDSSILSFTTGRLVP